jgi:tRNA C32,U32 (ribose-2'-O)-methylase TrmJ
MDTELMGASADLLAAADKRVYVPLHGFAESLNLSVAAALVLQQLLLLVMLTQSEQLHLCLSQFPWEPAPSFSHTQKLMQQKLLVLQTLVLMPR